MGGIIGAPAPGRVIIGVGVGGTIGLGASRSLHNGDSHGLVQIPIYTDPPTSGGLVQLPSGGGPTLITTLMNWIRKKVGL